MPEKHTEATHAVQQTAPPNLQPPPEPAEVFRCRVHNPTQRAKVVYGGEGSNIMYHIPPGQTIEAILPDHLIELLEDQERLDPDEPGLHVDELGKYEPPPPQAPRERRRRPGRQVTTT